MKKSLPLFLVCLFAFPRAFSQPDVSVFSSFPNYKTVLEKFYQSHRGFYFEGKEVQFMKKPAGWWVCLMDDQNSGECLGDPELFWSPALSGFKKIKWPEADADESADPVESHYRNYGTQFEHNLFFGYAGWQYDVVKTLEGKTRNNDSLTYFLARAFSGIARDFLSPGAQGFHKTDPDNPAGLKPVSQSVADSAQYYYNRSLQTFRKLHQLNPSFFTIVGRPYLKYSNEHLAAWLEFSMAGHPDMGTPFLADDIFDPYIISCSKNLLVSCPPKAILFTNGDTDTYPLLWLQLKKAIRQDVTIVNQSLLNTAKYIQFLSSRIPVAQRIAFTRDLDYYSDPETDAVAFHNPEPELFPIGMLRDYSFLGNITETKTFSVQPRISGTSPYLLRQDVALLDLIQSEGEERPICFSSTCRNSSLLGLNSNLWQRGLVYELFPVTSAPHPMTNLNLQYERHCEILLNEMDYEGYANLYPDFSWSEFNTGLINISNGIFVALDMAIEKNDSERVEKLIPIFERVIGDAKNPYSVFYRIYFSMIIEPWTGETEFRKRVLDGFEILEESIERFIKNPGTPELKKELESTFSSLRPLLTGRANFILSRFSELESAFEDSKK